MNCGKNGKAKIQVNYANPNGSIGSNNPLHVQRIAGETLYREYNPATSPRHLDQVKRYAELAGNCKKHGIKSPCGNNLLDTDQFDGLQLIIDGTGTSLNGISDAKRLAA